MLWQDGLSFKEGFVSVGDIVPAVILLNSPACSLLKYGVARRIIEHIS